MEAISSYRGLYTRLKRASRTINSLLQSAGIHFSISWGPESGYGRGQLSGGVRGRGLGPPVYDNDQSDKLLEPNSKRSSVFVGIFSISWVSIYSGIL